MYPTPINPATKSNAERVLYEAFRNQLDDSFIVFHSVAWQSKSRQGRARDGETDFLVVHPEKGLLVIEAKGGSLRYDPQTDKWTSEDINGVEYDISSPFVQARDSKYVLWNHLSQTPETTVAKKDIGYAVALTDVRVNNAWLGLDKPREIILDADDLPNLAEWVNRTMEYWRGQGAVRWRDLGPRLTDVLIDSLGKSWELRPALWSRFASEQQRLIQLTEQQFQVLDLLSRQRRALICGCAGSGKTLLAAEKAVRLARQGFRVLLTCFNKNLASHLRGQLLPCLGLDVLHFHDLCYKVADKAGTLPSGHTFDHGFFSEQLPGALLMATDVPRTRYDAIVVDEGQDFQEGWWIPLQGMLQDPDNGILYIFFDDNQRLYGCHGAFPISQEPYCLTVNCRNTKRIHELVVQFYQSPVRTTAAGPPGRPPEVVEYDSAQGLWPTLSSVLGHLTKEEHIPLEEIAVLSPLATKSELQAVPAADRALLSSEWPPAPGRVFFDTVYVFKGLERSVIILVELERWEKDLMSLLYTGCSRACNQLIVLLSKDAGPEVRQAFAGSKRGTELMHGSRAGVS
jgi:hypothetical protein